MSLFFKKSIAINNCHISLAKEGTCNYRLISEVTLKKDRQIKNVFLRDVSVNVFEALYDGALRMVSIKTNNLSLRMRGEAAAHNRLSNKLATIYNELLLETNFDGSINKIINIQEIRSKWEKIKCEIELEYSGSEIKNLLSKVASKLCNDNLVINEIKQYQFFDLLLKEIYGPFNEITPVVKKQWIPIFPKALEISENMILEEMTKEQVILKCFIKKRQENISYSGMFRFDPNSCWLIDAEVTIKEPKRSSLFRLIQIEE